MLNNSEFVKRLEKILEYYNITATAFAEKMDFNRSTISHLLSGRNKPSLEFVMKLLKKFPEVEMNWLLFGKGSFPSKPEDIKNTADLKQKLIATEEKPLNLFSKENKMEGSKTIHNNQNSKNIERIVIFYGDGSFNVYQN
jgi:transcriptional regulator with XRE-family HTH domain